MNERHACRWGKREAASVEFKTKEGPISSVSISHEGWIEFVIAEGENVHGAIPPTGNTNTRGFFRPDSSGFLKRWAAEDPTHHFAVGTGYHGEHVRQVGESLSLETVAVTCGSPKSNLT